MKFIEHRIIDPNIQRLIGKFLKAGMMEKGSFQKVYEGTPQGGICSPTLGNIYLHYALDLWFEKVVKKNCKGEAYMVRYCDDFVCCFEYEEEAKGFYEALKQRLNKFSLQVAEDKTKVIYFGRKAYHENKYDGKGKPHTFDFLGFTHYCSSRKNGSFRVKRKTSSKKFKASLLRCKTWLRENRTLPVGEIMEKLVSKLNGYNRYYGITDNCKNVRNYKDKVQQLIFKWLNRRSQRRSFNWNKFSLFLKRYPLPNPKVYVNIFELRKHIGYIL